MVLLGFRSDPLRDCRSTRKQHSLLYEQITAGALWLRDRLRQPLQTESKMFLPSSCLGMRERRKSTSRTRACSSYDFPLPRLLRPSTSWACFAPTLLRKWSTASALVRLFSLLGEDGYTIREKGKRSTTEAQKSAQTGVLRFRLGFCRRVSLSCL